MATNPRLVKEIDLALSLSFKVEVICFIFRNWSYGINKEILERLQKQGVKFHLIEAGKEDFFDWIISVAAEKINYFLSYFFRSERVLANAVSRRNYLLLKEAKEIKQADLVIGHNPGALYATKETANRLNCKAGFDVEDYHPGEGNIRYSQKIMKSLMKKILPLMDYVSFASDLIKQEVFNEIHQFENDRFTILNYFPKLEFLQPLKLNSNKLKLVWFSQNISAGRGLEYILPSVEKMPENIELYLFGNISEEYRKKISGKNIFIHSPLPQKDLHTKLKDFDIGLALEEASDYNRDICLTNKIIAYYQAGLFILASNTKAQQKFIAEKASGKIFDLKNPQMDLVLLELFKNLHILRHQKNERFESASSNNWESESLKLSNVWLKNTTIQ